MQRIASNYKKTTTIFLHVFWIGRCHFNVDKCKVMHIGRRNTRLRYFMNGLELITISEEKGLEVFITHDLAVSKQCSQAYLKASRVLT